ncbi:D-glycero-beta-D-manno-heptose 1-phosphate adenylyltransferase [Paludisphaera sp.]|uniref:D-glycero-beta-D-manno-heptose 1-phosphate adenylyltransferase n=1 Tax=Paludisphaera sp. TaxID=2017432 RepID=UPI00301E4D48
MFENRVLVVGDVMLDRHVHGHVRRISPEAPVPVVGLLGEVSTPGGAGNVAAGLAALGCDVALAGLIGPDVEGEALREALAAKGVAGPGLVERPGLATVSKTRILSEAHQQLLRLDRDGDRAAYAAFEDDLLAHALPMVGDASAVVLADYEKGVITPKVARAVIAECRRLGVPCVVDPKKVDFSPYAGATVVTPNQLEAERTAGRPLPDDDEAGRAAEELLSALGTDAMLITRGPQGMTLALPGAVHHVPSRTRDVADVTGAGDTVVAVMAACLGDGWPVLDACRLANTAAGIAVGRPGAYVVQAGELRAAWGGLSPKILDADAAARLLAEARRRGRRVVFTNGCFDILHAGHLSCLEGAKRLGDILVVGLNSDASVRELKGPSRPVIRQDDRAGLLAGLACVDVVVVFDDPTPIALIEAFEPDVLAKGGDYAIEDIVGADLVMARGGRVVAIPLVPGRSTTSILERRAG